MLKIESGVTEKREEQGMPSQEGGLLPVGDEEKNVLLDYALRGRPW